MTAMLRSVFGLAFGWLLARLVSLVARLHTPTTPEARKTSRRNFTRNAVLGGVLLNLGLLGGGFVRYFWPNKTGAFGSALTIPGSDVPPVDGTPFQYAPGKFYIVHNKDGIMALYWKCPHLGCTVPWNAGEHQFHCPCHGSIYNYDGVRIGGPAPRPMDLMAVTVQPNGDVVVDTGKITERSGYDPSQATPFPA